MKHMKYLKIPRSASATTNLVMQALVALEAKAMVVVPMTLAEVDLILTAKM